MSHNYFLGQYINVLSGFPFPSKKFNKDGKGKPLIRIRDLLEQKVETFIDEKYDSQFLIRKGDLLVGMDGDFNAAVWRGPVALLNQRICKLTTKDDQILDQSYLANVIAFELKKIHNLTPSTTVKHLSVKSIPEIKYELPPILEQRKIASILSRYDFLAENLRIQITKLTFIKKGITEKLIKFGHHGNILKKSNLDRKPSSWKTYNLSDLIKRINRKNAFQSCKNILTISAADGLVSQKEYFKKIVASKDTSGYTLLKKDDFAYNKSYSDGFPIGATRRLKKYSEGIVSPLYICFSINQKLLDIEFAEYLFDSQWFNDAIFTIAKEGARSHGLLNISIHEFFSLTLLLPPLSEQKSIAKIISRIELLINKKKQKLIKVESLKYGLANNLLKDKKYSELNL